MRQHRSTEQVGGQVLLREKWRGRNDSNRKGSYWFSVYSRPPAASLVWAGAGNAEVRHAACRQGEARAATTRQGQARGDPRVAGSRDGALHSRMKGRI